MRFVFAIVVLFATLTLGCKNEPEVHVEPPLVYKSPVAPYEIELPPRWSREDSKALNTHADFAASFGGSVYVIVIPQELPAFPDVEPPDAIALKKASMAVMETQVDGLKVDRQGPVKVGGKLAQSVLATGAVESQPVKYATTYVTHQGWGFQIVAWGPEDRTSLVTSQADEFLDGLRFIDRADTRNPEAAPDIESQASDAE